MKCSTSRPSRGVRGLLALAFAQLACVVALLSCSGLARAASPTIAPATATVAPRGSQTFTASGGSGAGYTWSMAAAPSGGSISSTGVYTAGPTPNVTDQVQVVDSALAVATATVNVTGGLLVTPPGITLAPGNTQQFTATGGGPPYTWSLVMNTSGGSITGGGLYTAGATLGADTVRVADSNGNAVTVPVTVVAKVPLGTPCTAAGTCPTTADGNAHCVDDVCCDSACGAQCQACSSAGSVGTCTTISGPPVGMRTACPVSDPKNPCSSKTCDGMSATSCDAYVGVTTTCGAASCIDLVGTPQAVCQGDGTCAKVAQQSCAPFACLSDQCATSCTDDAACAPGDYCNVTTGKCVVPPDAGASSGGGGQAATGKSSSGGCGLGGAPPADFAGVVALLAPLAAMVRRRRRR